MFSQYIANCRITYAVPQVLQGAGDPVIAPTSILSCESYDESFDFRRYRRSSRRPPIARTIELSGDKIGVPSKNGSGFDDSRDGFKSFSPDNPKLWIIGLMLRIS